jgi:hypothetical protein
MAHGTSESSFMPNLSQDAFNFALNSGMNIEPLPSASASDTTLTDGNPINQSMQHLVQLDYSLFGYSDNHYPAAVEMVHSSLPVAPLHADANGATPFSSVYIGIALIVDPPYDFGIEPATLATQNPGTTILFPPDVFDPAEYAEYTSKFQSTRGDQNVSLFPSLHIVTPIGVYNPELIIQYVYTTISRSRDSSNT